MERFNHRVELAYVGDQFHGFVRQLDRVTVEGVILDALRTLDPDLGGLAVGGRTDRGVHATGQVISFWTRRPLDLDLVRSTIDAASPHLAALSVSWVPRAFHAQFSARSRRYVYLWPDPEGRGREAARLDAMLRALEGRRCFSAFARDTPAGAPTVKRMIEAGARAVRVDGEPHLQFELEAEGFLRRMVRVLVASAIRALDHGEPEDALAQLAARGDRGETPPPADPGGLRLVRVRYDPVVGYSRRGRVERPPPPPRDPARAHLRSVLAAVRGDT